MGGLGSTGNGLVWGLLFTVIGAAVIAASTWAAVVYVRRIGR